MALITEAEGTGRSCLRPQAPHSVRTENATVPLRVCAKRSAARTPGCQRGAATADAHGQAAPAVAAAIAAVAASHERIVPGRSCPFARRSTNCPLSRTFVLHDRQHAEPPRHVRRPGRRL